MASNSPLPIPRKENPRAEKMTALRTEGHTTDHTLLRPLSKAATSDTELSERGRDRAGERRGICYTFGERIEVLGLSFGGGLITAGAIS